MLLNKKFKALKYVYQNFVKNTNVNSFFKVGKSEILTNVRSSPDSNKRKCEGGTYPIVPFHNKMSEFSAKLSHLILNEDEAQIIVEYRS